MAVPVGSGMSLRDVSSAITTDIVTGLRDAFSDSIEEGFDDLYYDGDKDQLRDFQGYSHIQTYTGYVTGDTHATIVNEDTTWDSAVTASDGDNIASNVVEARIEKQTTMQGYSYSIYRGFMSFDLSGLPANPSISKATFWFKIDDESGLSNWTVTEHAIELFTSSYDNGGFLDKSDFDSFSLTLDSDDTNTLYDTTSNWYKYDVASINLGNIESYLSNNGSPLKICVKHNYDSSSFNDPLDAGDKDYWKISNTTTGSDRAYVEIKYTS